MVDNYFTVSLSVDALEWTKHWLGGRRCDLLAVSLAINPQTTPKVRLVAVESKARTEKDPILLDPKTDPFKEAIEQVTVTLDALNEILCPEQTGDPVSDIKQGAFVEQLLSEVLAQIYPIEATDLGKSHVLKVLTDLSRRSLKCDHDLVMEGLVVVTQPEATVETARKRFDAVGQARVWPMTLVRCGIPELRRLFEREMPALADALVSEPDHTDVSTSSAAAAASFGGDETFTAATREQKPRGTVDLHRRAILPTEPLSDLDNSSQAAKVESGFPANPEIIDLIDQLQIACKLRRFPIEDIDPSLARIGPTLISVSVALEAGGAIGPIQAANKDLARELGVRSISIENDPRPYHIQFLIPRRERVFPALPADSAKSFDTETRQYLRLALGATVEGATFETFVSDWPHLLVAGTTGSGKTNLLMGLLIQLGRLPEHSSDLIIVDGKAEYDYVGLLPPSSFHERFPDVLLGFEHAAPVLQWLVEEEISSRREALRAYFSKNPSASRQPREAYIASRESGNSFPIRPLVVVIDEFAEIMQASGKSAKTFSDLVQRAVQTGRSALVHLLLATQRPGTAVISGEIKANLPSRIALALPSHHDSMTIIDRAGAEDLLGTGDMFFLPSSGHLIRLQAFNAAR